MLTRHFNSDSVFLEDRMKSKPPSVRVLIAALVAVFVAPVTAGAGGSPQELASDAAVVPIYTVSMTAYNAVPEQTSSHPNVTASGAFSNTSIVAARSQDLGSELPFGTVIEIDSATSSPTCGYGAVGSLIGYRVIADTMNAEWHDKIDILMPQKTTVAGKASNPARVLGLCHDVSIKVVGHIDVSNMPQNQAQLASSIHSSDEVAIAK